MAKNTFPTTGFVRADQIHAPNGPLPVSRSLFWQKVRSGEWPQPFRISARVTGFRAQDVLDLIAKIEEEAV
jgi:prophage regulatory protein